jgi:hypothetical protein
MQKKKFAGANFLSNVIPKEGASFLSPLSLFSTTLRVIRRRLASLSLSSGDLAGRSDQERGGQLPCTVSSFRFLGLEPFLGVLPHSMGGALDLGAQIRSVLGFLLIVALLLWPERVAASGFTAPLNKFGAAGFIPLLIKAKLFLAGRGGEEEWKLWAASSALRWWCCGCGCRRSCPLSALGGAVGGGVLALLCGGSSEGRSQEVVLIHAVGSRATAILR